MNDELEPGRPDPGFTIEVMNGMRLAKADAHQLALALQDVYDIAVGSMDFGSGFLGTEEIANLRILGKAIGAKPLHYQCDELEPDPSRSWTPEGRPCTCGAETP